MLLQESKQKFQESNEKLKREIGELNEMSKQVDTDKQSYVEEKKKSIAEVLKVKEQEVEEKIKRGKKLTTQDLLVFQKNFYVL